MLESDLSPNTKNQDTIYLADYTPPAYLIDQVKLEFRLGDTTQVTAQLSLQRQGEHDQELILDGGKIRLIDIKMGGKSLKEEAYEVSDTSLTIHQVPAEFELTIITELEPHLNTELSGLYKSSGNFCTQCEAEGFRRITYFLDRPDVLSEYEVTLIAEKQAYPVLLSNGNLVASGETQDGEHWQVWHDPHPKPSYLFALVAGDLQHINDQFTTCSGQDIELNIYTQAHNIDKCEHAMESLKHAMRWDEEVYGREYDLDIYNIVAVDDFNMGAMENKGLNVFNSKYVLANQQTATDADYEGIESVIAHEYFHNWSGNRVTCRDWFQLSLKEGFTVFRDQEFSADMGSRGVKRIQDVQILRTHQFKEDAGPMAHPVRPDSYQEINNFYTVTIYNKGAEVIRMLYAMLGAEAFRKGTDLYFERHDGQAVTTDDFVCALEQANQLDLSQFRYWYTQAGTPQVDISQQYDQEQGKLCLTLSQTCPDTPGQNNKKPFVIPISIALFDQHGKTLKTETIILNQPSQQFDFPAESQPIVSCLRGFSAPVKVNFSQSNEELSHLMRYETDGFSRWEAGQRLSLELILPALQQPDQKYDEAVYQLLLKAYRTLLTTEQPDLAILAQMLRLPVQSYIAEQLIEVDPQRISVLRQTLVKRLAQDLENELVHVYQSYHQSEGTFSLTAKDTAARALKNVALSYLVELAQPDYFELAQQQYQQANNMTDRIAAFKAIVHSNWQGRQAVIDDFYQRWQEDTLVLDKWFAIQATAPNGDQLEVIKALMSHPSFAINNPNKVRALIGAFSSNHEAFHCQDGAAYEFFADIVLQLNDINPQIAARLVSVFNQWRRYAEPWSTAMKAQLNRINQTPNLVKDIREIVGKALA